MTPRQIEQLNAAERENKQNALRALVSIQGYNATPEQILDVSARFGVSVSELEGMYFDEMDAAGDR